jgi:hypothetical protein
MLVGLYLYLYCGSLNCRRKSTVQYSRLPHNPYLSVDGPGYGVWEFMGYEGSILVKRLIFVAPKTMAYGGVSL